MTLDELQPGSTGRTDRILRQRFLIASFHHPIIIVLTSVCGFAREFNEQLGYLRLPEGSGTRDGWWYYSVNCIARERLERDLVADHEQAVHV